MSRLRLPSLVLLTWTLLAGCMPQAPASAPTALETAPPSAPTAAPTLPPTQSVAIAPTTAPTAAPTAQPTAEPTAAPTAAPTAVPTVPATAAATAAPTAAPTGDQQILFLSGGDLVALDVGTGSVATLAEGVTGFAASADGSMLGLTRGAGAAGEIWALRRASGELWQLTANDRAESTLSWAPDGSSLVYTSAPAAQAFPPDWQSWSAWCVSAEARLIDVPATAAPAGAERVLGAGCEPAFGPDGKRIVFTTAPTADATGLDFTGANNSVRMVNRQGANGWSVAMAGDGTAEGQLVYSPSWSPDAGQVSYQRFVGYQVLVDINLTEAGSSYQRNGAPISVGAGWLLPPRYAPRGGLVAVTEHNFSDARGYSGYDIWQTSLLRLGQPSQVAMPEGEVTMGATEVERLRWATGAAWAPDGAALAVALPAGWQPGLNPAEPLFPGTGAGELWRWRPGAEPDQKLADGVDFGSPLLWLAAAQG